MQDQRIWLADGRVVGLAAQATQAGLRIIGIDRPGYGLSTPQPGRTIAGCQLK